LDALNQSHFTGNWAAVTEVIESWKATANIKADPTIAAGVEEGIQDLAAGRGVGWDELRGELGL